MASFSFTDDHGSMPVDEKLPALPPYLPSQSDNSDTEFSEYEDDKKA